MTTALLPRLLRETTALSRTFLCVVLMGGPLSAGAAVIVSGDNTPLFYLTDTGTNPGTPGNRTFFDRILGGGTEVGVLGTANASTAAREVDEFYNGLDGVTSAIHVGVLTSEVLASLDLLVVPVPDDSFSVDEISAVASFLDGGGSIFVSGESASFGATNNHVNGLLGGLGLDVSIIASSIDPGPQVATGSQIVPHDLTAGISSFNYGLTSEVMGGDPLFLTHSEEVFLAIAGMIDPGNGNGGNGNGNGGVPEPNPAGLLALALIGLWSLRRGAPTFASTPPR